LSESQIKLIPQILYSSDGLFQGMSGFLLKEDTMAFKRKKENGSNGLAAVSIHLQKSV
jgi:hypothetical protein